MGFFGGGGGSAASPEESVYGRSVYGIGTSTPSITVSDYSSGTASSVTFGNGKAIIAPETIWGVQGRNCGVNEIMFTPFYFHKTTNVNKLLFYIGSSPAATRSLQLGLYSSSSQGLPETLIASSNYEFSIPTTIGSQRLIVRDYGTPISVSKGIVWMYCWVNGTVEILSGNENPKSGTNINLYGWQATSSVFSNYGLRYVKTYSSTPVSSLTQSFSAGATQDTFYYNNNVPNSAIGWMEVDP
jgi:hypothetical protein